VKKVLLIFSMISILLLLVGCIDIPTESEPVTIDCVPGYEWSVGENSCVLLSDAYIFNEDIYTTYKIQFEGDNYRVYRTYVFLSDDTDILVDMGYYNGYHYYFDSDSHYNYYLVEKNGVYKRLSEAIESEWFTIEDMVTLFNISQLQSEAISWTLSH